MSVIFWNDETDKSFAFDCDEIIGIAGNTEGATVVLSTGHAYYVRIPADIMTDNWKEILLSE